MPGVRSEVVAVSTSSDGQGPAGAGRPGEFADSRPSVNNSQPPTERPSRRDHEIDRGALPDGLVNRPISVQPDTKLRDEAILVIGESGPLGPLDAFEDVPEDVELQGRSVHRVLQEWRDWMIGYENSHIEYVDPDGGIERGPLENSYQQQYQKRYYAKIKDWERGIERELEDLTTVMLTFSASNENANGGRRCPADHMRDIADGWDTAYSTLWNVLDGYEWDYAKVWEPHQSGYGHMHVAVAVEDPAGTISPETFRPVMQSYVKNTDPAGSKAHGLTTPGMGDAVSVNDDVENLGSYIAEYVGMFGDEALDRSIETQLFYATCWATGTRRVEFSGRAQDRIAREHFRRETGLRPEDRGGSTFEQWRGGEGEDPPDNAREAESGRWHVDSICTVRGSEPMYSDPTAGGQRLTEIDGRTGVDPPPVRE